MKKDYISQMKDDVMLLMENGFGYRSAFAEVAHRNVIFHGKERESYNFHFREVLRRIKRMKKMRNVKIGMENWKKYPVSPFLKELPDYKKLAGNDRD